MKKRATSSLAVALFLILVLAQSAFASGTGMPWESPLEKILDSCTGPVAKIGGIIAIVATGLGLAFSEGGGLMRKALCIAFGLSLSFSAATFISSFLGYTGGLGF